MKKHKQRLSSKRFDLQSLCIHAPSGVLQVVTTAQPEPWSLQTVPAGQHVYLFEQHTALGIVQQAYPFGLQPNRQHVAMLESHSVVLYMKGPSPADVTTSASCLDLANRSFRQAEVHDTLDAYSPHCTATAIVKEAAASRPSQATVGLAIQNQRDLNLC
jgi:hypothetical protein